MIIKLDHDVYEISKRILDIDKGYYIVYNTSSGRFEIHNRYQNDGTYCLTLPYNQLDYRALTYVLKTSSTNIEKIIEDIENDNKILENAEKRKALNELNESIDRLKE